MKVKLKQRNPENLEEWIEKEIYLDGILKSNLDLGVSQLKKDWDQCWFVDGMEGAGKSNLAITCAFYVSPEERRHNLLDRVIVKIEDTIKVIKEAQPFDAVVIDESYGGMSASGHMVKLNRILQRVFTEIRAKNLFIFVVAPTFMDINRYFAIWRSKCLLHVYADKHERGFCSFFNAEKKKRLYILGRQRFYNYGIVKPNFRFRFTDAARKIIDWEKYKQMKIEKNLDIEDQEPSRDVMRKCWIQVRDNMNKLTKPLTQNQFAELTELSARTIREYDKFLRETKK